MPIEPAEKARLRMLMHRLDRDLFQHLRTLESCLKIKDSKNKKEAEKVKKLIIAGLDSVASVFAVNKKAEYLFGNTFTLLDASILPLIWRLKYYEISTKPEWDGMMRYARKFFGTPEFAASLTPAERGMPQ